MTERTPRGRLADAMLRLPVPWVFVVTYLAGVALENAFHLGRFIWDYRLPTPAGLVVFAIGAALAAWGWFIFHRRQTTRVPGEASTTLVTWGPYRFTRNPMYVGLSLAYLGEAAMLHQIAPVVLLPLTIAYLNLVVIPLEEERLGAVFGAEYERYQNKVRRWL
jgi:protein-S-isoprenylcysteine O-methyltransferase Ste14